LSRLLTSPLYFVVLGLLCGMFGTRLGWRSRNRMMLPLLQGLLGFLAFAAAWRGVGPIAASLAIGGWAIGVTLFSLFRFAAEPEQVDLRVLHARPYRESMLEWLRTGKGPEARPLRTVWQHVRELAVYLAAALLTANLLAIVLGAILLNAMNGYVARLLGAAKQVWRVRLLAWNAWSVVRVAAYVMLGSAAAELIAARLGYSGDPRQVRIQAIAGAVGVVLDLLLELILSRPWGRALGAAVDLDAASRSPG